MQARNTIRAKRKVRLLLCVILLSMATIRLFVFTAVRVSGTSMLPTLQDKQIVFVNKTAYWNSTPQEGDIVIAREPIDNIKVVKRITGKPGDTIMFEGKTVVLKNDEYYIEGDNRENSIDSRAYGLICSERIIGKVIE